MGFSWKGEIKSKTSRLQWTFLVKSMGFLKVSQMDFSRKLIYERFNCKMLCICKFLESEFDERVYTFEINQMYVIGHVNPM